MLKLTKVIINTNRELIGFMVKGKEKEFGGFSNDEIERGIPIDQIIKTNFNNNQIYVNNGSIVEKNNFRINQLPMCVYTSDGYVDMDSTINIIGRFIQNNENIGFRLAFSDGSENNFRYANVLMLCKWFKPGNFAVRTSSKNKQYICGKNGISLESIPATTIGEEPKVKPKRLKSAAKEKTEEVKGSIEAGFDILDIYGFISECNGCVIKLPSETYIKTSVLDSGDEGDFTSLGIGEVATPVPLFNPTKLNVNAGFKKVGIVNVDMGGTKVPVTTFVYRNKNIFYNGENHMKKFGIAVPTDKESELLSKLGGSLAFEKITDSSVTAPLGQVIDAKSLSFYTVDASKIDLISKQKRKESILSTSEINALCMKMYELKLISKALGPKGGLLKELKTVMSADEIASTQGKKVFGAFAMYSKDGLEAVQKAGIDIYTGAYNQPGGSTYTKKSSGGDTESVEIEYLIKGYDINKITGAAIIKAVKDNDTTVVSEKIIKVLSEVLSETDFKKKYIKAEKLYKKTEAKINELVKKLWLHNASMYIDGNKSSIHTHDAASWSIDNNSRVKTATVYKCNARNCEGLLIKFKGVTI